MQSSAKSNLPKRKGLGRDQTGSREKRIACKLQLSDTLRRTIDAESIIVFEDVVRSWKTSNRW